MQTDIEIARSAKIERIATIGEKLGINSDDLELYGHYKAKLPLKLIDESRIKNSKLILVTALTPTPAGEGKTTVSIGLSQALNGLGKKTVAVLREPSLGPVFGIKGGATGGGQAQVLPMEDINLHFTGDIPAVERANNLLAALIDNELQNKKSVLNLDPRTISWKRVMDMNDRALRDIVIGLGGTANGVPRETGFDITAASEIMAILCLSLNMADLKEKLGNIFVGYSFDKKPVFARDLGAQGAMATLLKDAIKPNLVQTIGGHPAIIHGGPFANIAQGTNSIIATKMGLSLGDFVVTEAGFGCDLGAEKFLDIKCVHGKLRPNAIVLVATVRALKYHGGIKLKELKNPDPDAVFRGLDNLKKHIENIRLFNLEPIVAINRFSDDKDEEISVILEMAKIINCQVAIANIWANGGQGGLELAKKVIHTVDNNQFAGCPENTSENNELGKVGQNNDNIHQPENGQNTLINHQFAQDAQYNDNIHQPENGQSTLSFKPLYDWDWPIKKKIETIATKIYGASEISYQPKAISDIKRINKLGLDKLPICIAKTQKSLSDNPDLIGCPKDFVLTVREIEISSGAGFLVPITGDMMRMPGLPEKPAAYGIDIDDSGNISGLS